MSDDVSWDGAKSEKRNHFKGQNFQSLNDLSEICNDCDGVTETRDDKFSSLKEILGGLIVSTQTQVTPTLTGNSSLSQVEEACLESAFENNCGKTGDVVKKMTDKVYLTVGQTSGLPRHIEATKTKENKGQSQIHGKLTNQRKSSLPKLKVLPPLMEQRCERLSRTGQCSSHNGRNSVTDFSERKGLEVPCIVLSKADNEHNSSNHLNLPKIDATIANSRYHQAPSSSTPQPNALAPPIIVEPFKARRPTAQTNLQGKRDKSVDELRLPHLGKRSSKDGFL